MRHREIAVVSTTSDCCVPAIHHEIPQIDVSMHLPNYPGSRQPLFGQRLLLPENQETCSPHRPVDFLFRAHNFAEAVCTGARLQSTTCTLTELRKRFLSDPHPVQIVLTDRRLPVPAEISYLPPQISPGEGDTNIHGNLHRLRVEPSVGV